MSRPAALAVCTTAIGDTVLCTPALEALGQVYDLDVVVHQHRLPLLTHQPDIQRLLPYRNNPLSRFGLWRQLRQRRYDRVVVLHANDDIIKLLKHLRYELAGNIQGWRLPRWRIHYQEVDRSQHVVLQRLALAQWAGAAPVTQQMRVYLSDQELAEARDWLDQHGLGDDRPTVAMCLGASHVFKRWPAVKFGQAAARLRQAGARVYWLGSAQEEPLMARAERDLGAVLPRLRGVDLRQLSSVLARTDLLVTNDTGPLHLAQAVDCRVLGLFGPTDPLTIGPMGLRHRVVKVERTCDPCLTKRCEKATCMEAMAVDQVVEDSLAMLAEAGWKI